MILNYELYAHISFLLVSAFCLFEVFQKQSKIYFQQLSSVCLNYSKYMIYFRPLSNQIKNHLSMDADKYRSIKDINRSDNICIIQ